MQCNFPAAELIRMRRQLVVRADASNDPMFIRNVAEFVKATDDLRLAHYELTECPCWLEVSKALRAMMEAA